MEFNATFLVSAISFIVFATIMNWIFYTPIQKVVLERQKFIDDTNEEAKFNREKSESILKDKDSKIEKTKSDAKKIILDKSEEVKTQKAELALQAQQKANAEVDSAKGDLHRSKDEAEMVLTDETKKLAEIISAKILGEGVNK